MYLAASLPTYGSSFSVSGKQMERKMILYNTFFPLPGEHILSWLQRLADANGFYDFALFCDLFVFDHKTDKRFFKREYTDTGFDFPVGNLLKHFPTFFAEKISAEGILCQNTLFNLYEPFMPEAVQSEFKEYFINKPAKAMHNPLQLRDVKLCYCPECAKEDTEEYGSAYIHLAHQIRGVYVCYKHGTYLYNCNIVNGEIICSGNNTKAMITRIIRTSSNKDFAIMCKDLLENGWSSKMNVLEECIKRGVSIVFKDNYQLFLHTVDDTGMLEDVEFLRYMRWNKNDVNIPASFIEGKNKIDVNKILVIMFVLYGDAKRLRSVLNNNGRLSQREKTQIKINNVTNEYSVINTENINKNLYMKLQHNICGNASKYSMKEFMNGKRCPCCQKDVSFVLVREELLRLTGIRLKIIDDYGKGICKVIDTDTGETFTLTYEKILQEIRRPFLSPVLNIPYSGIVYGKERQKVNDITSQLQASLKEVLINTTDRRTILDTIDKFVSEALPPECAGMMEEIRYRLNYYFTTKSISLL